MGYNVDKHVWNYFGKSLKWLRYFLGDINILPISFGK